MGAKTRKLSQINDSLIEWQSVVVADGSTGLTAVAGRGYFINTTGGAITVTFPASPKIGDTIIINDYATTFATNNVSINFNGNKLEADTTTATLQTNDQTHTFVFTDTTQGWKIVNQDTGTGIQPLFITATGGTITTSGNFKIHTFTGDDTFTVSQLGNSPVVPSGGPAEVDYLVVAGGGAGAGGVGGGGGAGGFREGRVLPAPESYTASPLVAPAGLPVSVTSYPITVGAGGVKAGPAAGRGASGSNSVFSTITSTAGGGAGGDSSPEINVHNGLPGGSGGGGSRSGPSPIAGGTGNTPPVNPSQGNNGETGLGVPARGGGGGGAGAAGGTGTQTYGGSGVGTGINPSPTVGAPGPSPTLRYFAGGGGGGGDAPYTGVGVNGGIGGGGNSYPGTHNPNSSNEFATDGTANTGGGGGGGTNSGTSSGGASGGKGIVVIRYKFQ
jgi:hypothetical protein